MPASTSLWQTLQGELPQIKSQIYFKSTLTALSHALEDVVLEGSDRPLVIANFQQERFYRQEIRRYERIASVTDHVYVLAAPESESGFALNSGLYETVPLADDDALVHEWHLVIVGHHYAACLVCREQSESTAMMDSARRFAGFWGFDQPLCMRAAQWLLQRVVQYRPELATRVNQTLNEFGLTLDSPGTKQITNGLSTENIFGQRLMTYLQASQYKLLKAYRILEEQAQKEQLIKVMAMTIRQSLAPDQVLQTAITELGRVFNQCRCILYRCQPNDEQVTIHYEFAPPGARPLLGKTWAIRDNPLLLVALSQEHATVVFDVNGASIVTNQKQLQHLAKKLQIRSWILAPIQYQGEILGMVELHACGADPYRWSNNDVSLVEALATQVGVALIQADMFMRSETLNQQLQALKKTQTNLINIVGHELRTPLSTIQVCLECLDSDPDMEPSAQQIMLDTAQADATRMRKLIGDFLILSRLEGQKKPILKEPIRLEEALGLAMSGIASGNSKALPDIHLALPTDLPLLHTDGEGLVDVLRRLLDNACKFTTVEGQVTISATVQTSPQNRAQYTDTVTVSIADTGRGIEAGQLQTIFDSFYQAEDYLQRSVGGAGLGLSICRQIIQTMDGKIWAESQGREHGSTFFIQLPIS